MQSRLRALALTAALLLSVPLPAAAQETQPGDACTSGEIHHMRQTSGPENPGTGYFLVCDGANWRLITEWDTATGNSLFQVDYDSGACDALKEARLRYTSASKLWEYCDGTNWSSLGSASAAALNDLIDVNILSAADQEVLTYDSASGTWASAPTSATSINALDDIADVNAPVPSAGQVLKWSGSAWIADTDAGGQSLWSDSGAGYIEYGLAGTGIKVEATAAASPTFLNLDSLGDVSVASPSDSQVLTYDNGAGEWIAANAQGDFVGLTDTPADYSGAANKIVAVNGSGNALVFTDETDPKIGTLTNGKWCTTDGSVVNCASDPPDASPAGADRQIQFNSGGAFGSSATFKLMADGDLLLTGVHTGTASAPASGSGGRMFFDSQVAAFRAGYVTGTQWNTANIGDRSIGLGHDAQASSSYSIAIGQGVTSSGWAALALGREASVSGNYAAVIGLGANGGTIPVVSGQSSFGIFMGDQSGKTLTATNTMGLFGGKMVIDPRVPASNLSADAALDVAGGIKLDFDSDACTVTKEGTLRFNSAGAALELCDGAVWAAVGGGGALAIDDLSDAAANYTRGNVFLGEGAGANIDTGGSGAEQNVTLGQNTAAVLTTGDRNIFIGHEAGLSQTTAVDSVFIGYRAGARNVGGHTNTAVGSYAFENFNPAVAFNYNTSVGFLTLRGVAGASTGQRNTAIGAKAGEGITSGSDNILIGYDVDPSSATASFELNIGNAIYADLSTGNVGIGTASPFGKLDVAGGDIRMDNDFNVEWGGNNSWINGSNASAALVFGTSNTERARINNTGLIVTGKIDASTQFLGQSADSPTAPSFAWTGDVDTGMYRAGADTVGFTTAGVQRAQISSAGLNVMSGQVLGVFADTATAPSYTWSGDTDTGMWHAATNGIGFSTNGTEALRINGANEFIFPAGNSNTLRNDGPTGKLLLLSGGTDTGGAGITMYGNSHANIGRMWLNMGTSGWIRFRHHDGAAWVTDMQINNTGAVNIYGLVSCGGLQTNAAGLISCTSDERLKDVHEAFTPGLAAVTQINPQTYSWKEGTELYDDGVRYSGFIAQDVERAVPEAVTVGKDGYKQISTNTILATVVNAVKELKGEKDADIEALKAANQNQTAELEELRAENAALKASFKTHTDAVYDKLKDIEARTNAREARKDARILTLRAELNASRRTVQEAQRAVQEASDVIQPVLQLQRDYQELNHAYTENRQELLDMLVEVKEVRARQGGSCGLDSIDFEPLKRLQGAGPPQEAWPGAFRPTGLSGREPAANTAP